MPGSVFKYLRISISEFRTCSSRYDEVMEWNEHYCVFIWIMLDRGINAKNCVTQGIYYIFVHFSVKNANATLYCIVWCTIKAITIYVCMCGTIYKIQTTKVPIIIIPFLPIFQQGNTYIHPHLMRFTCIPFSWMNFTLIIRYYMTQSLLSLFSSFRSPQSTYIIIIECMEIC